MTSALSQPIGFSPAELPGSRVLRFDPTGDSGVLIHDTGSAHAVVHTRFMFNASQSAGGELVIAGGMDQDGNSIWQLTLDAAAPSLALDAGAAQCGVDLEEAIAWQTIEIALDTLAGTVTLRLNGIERDSDDLAIAPTRYVWLGGAFMGSGFSGHLDVDQWILATAPIGVPSATPQYDHGGDPRRWLVVYNRNNNQSAQWADAYRDRRAIPFTNLCGLDLPTSEVITSIEFDSMRQQIAAYLNDNDLAGEVIGILLGFGVPGYADLTGPANLTPITSYLHTDDAYSAVVVNALHQDPIATRPAAADYSGFRLTGRVDAADLASALELLNRADSLMQQPLAHDQDADLFVDIQPTDPTIGPAYRALVSDWANGPGLDGLRLPANVFDETAPDAVSGDAVVWGWRDAAPPSTFFASPAGRRAICLQFDPAADPAVSLRTPAATDWLSSALQAGYAAAAAPSRAYTLSALPLPHLFFEALRMGWTLAEAWMVAQPFVRSGLQIVGDPLMTIGFPKAGFDVFGPVDRLDQIDFDQPLAILHEGQHSLQLTPSDAPPTDSSARYLIRRYDHEGRADFAAASAYAAIAQDQVIQPAHPAWPAFEGWRVKAVQGQRVLGAVWPRALRALGIDRVELFAQTGSDDPVLIDHAVPKAGERRAVFTLSHQAIATRYRFAIVQGSANLQTPWSAWVQPTAEANTSLTLLEAQP